jgi:hypothetical protein
MLFFFGDEFKTQLSKVTMINTGTAVPAIDAHPFSEARFEPHRTGAVADTASAAILLGVFQPQATVLAE